MDRERINVWVQEMGRWQSVREKSKERSSKTELENHIYIYKTQ
jgi:hypothetical protein